MDFVLDLFVAEGPALLPAAVVPSGEQFLTDQFLVCGRVDALVSIEVGLDGSRLEGVLLNLVVDRGHVRDYIGTWVLVKCPGNSMWPKGLCLFLRGNPFKHL